MKKIFVIMSLFFLTNLISACAKQPFSSLDCCSPQDTPSVTQEQLNDFAAQGVTVMPKGDTLRIILPTDKFFKTNLVTLKDNKKVVLANIAQLLKGYGNASVKVMGYTDTIGNQEDNKNLSFGRAQAVLAYLWSQGLDAEHLYSVGLGGKQLVADPNDVLANAANRRIEILVHAHCTQCY
ncbi:MAG: OmpA family protein [Gammaproteobacteria bacterium]|jgi:outer membrane protein OmpA-like peptidoglycan-associated protein|nr:OmpA family protein [Gammaproteobacteria bacterium]